MNSIHAIRKARQGGREAGHFLAIRARKLGADLVEIDFEDSGCGISSENMKKLFKPFYTTKDIGEGTGLGLAIVAQLIREMNGQVSVASVVDQGTTFTLKFQSTPTSS
jgi:signal transduction histidine kinase